MTEEKKVNPNAQKQLQVQLDDATAQGQYVNMSLVNHTETEFIFDFIFMQPMEARAKVRSRILSSPKHAKRFMMILQENISRYEQRHGEIDISQPQNAPIH